MSIRSLVIVHLLANIYANQLEVGNASDCRVEVKHIFDGGKPASLKLWANNNGIVA